MIEQLIEPGIQIPESRKRFSNSGLASLIVPIVIEQFLVFLVGIADTLMISYAGEAAVSSVSLVDQLNNVFIMIFGALASGGAVVASQYIGNEDKESGSLAASQLVMIIGLFSVFVEALILLFGEQIFHLLFRRVEATVVEAGLLYLKISAYSYPFLAVYHGCAALFRSMGKTKVIMEVSVAMNMINIAGNAIGVFVLHAGVAGVAYPTLFSRIFAAAVMFYLALNKKNEITVCFSQIFIWKAGMIIRIFSIAVPNSIENGLFQFSKVMLSSIVAGFGTMQIAANGVAQSFWSMAALFCLSMGPVFITIIGQYMGAGDKEGADYYMKKLLRITYMGSILWNFLFFCATPLILKLYSLNNETVRLVIILVILHNTFNALLCPVGVSVSCGLRASGDVKYTMFTSIFATVICRVIFSVLFGVVMELGVLGITLAMVVDWAVKALMTGLRYKSGKWKNFKVI